MTFCLGMRLKNGLVGIADTRVTAGNEYITARKLSTYEFNEGACFLMTSGLRSVRDKTITYFERHIENRQEPFAYTYEAVNALASCMRQVAKEDKASLEENGTAFCINVLFGGRFPSDKTHKLYKIYSEGNWIEIGEGTPYHIIGASGYGKPILDRTLKFTDPSLLRSKWAVSLSIPHASARRMWDCPSISLFFNRTHPIAWSAIVTSPITSRSFPPSGKRVFAHPSTRWTPIGSPPSLNG